MGIQIQNEELDAILDDVEAAVKPLLKSERDRLAKAGEDSPPPEEESAPSPEASPEASAPPEASAGGPPPGPEASAGGPPPGPDAGGAGGPPPEDDGFPQDPAQLHAMIAQLPVEQVQALYLASKQVLQAQRGAGGAGPGPEASAGGPPPPPPQASPAGPPAMKAEMRPSPGNGGKAIKKSENQENDMSQKELEEVKKLLKTQAEQMDLQGKALELVLSRVVGAPMRKSMTAVSQAQVKPGSEPETNKQLSKAEISDRLKEKIQAKSLTKKDRAAVYAFYDSGANDVSKIAHLLKD
jgi:hypothetical protein